MSQPVLVRPEAVGVSAISVNATRRRRDRILSTVSDSVMVVTEKLQRDCWIRSGSNLSRRETNTVDVDSTVGFVGGQASAFLSVIDGCTDFAGEVAVMVTSPAVLAGDIAVEVAEDVAVDVISLANAGMVTVGVADLADDGMAFPADPAGAVNVSHPWPMPGW